MLEESRQILPHFIENLRSRRHIKPCNFGQGVGRTRVPLGALPLHERRARFRGDGAERAPLDQRRQPQARHARLMHRGLLDRGRASFLAWRAVHARFARGREPHGRRRRGERARRVLRRLDQVALRRELGQHEGTGYGEGSCRRKR